MTTFDDDTRALLDGKSFATVSTLNPGGEPQSSVVWFKRGDDTIVFSTAAFRMKARNLARDPHVSVSIYHLANPYRSVEIRGVADLVEDHDRVLPRGLSQRYLGEVARFVP